MTGTGQVADKQALIKRLHRIQGQVHGLERMVEDDRYCLEILTQIGAATTALEALAIKLLERHVAQRVAEVANGDTAAATRDVIEAVERFARTR